MADITETQREVVSKTINAYDVEKFADGTVKLRSGGRVVIGDNYYEVLARYVDGEVGRLEKLPEHLRDDRKSSISDGLIALESYDSSGWSPIDILEEVTGQPTQVVVDLVLDELEERYSDDGS